MRHRTNGVNSTFTGTRGTAWPIPGKPFFTPPRRPGGEPAGRARSPWRLLASLSALAMLAALLAMVVTSQRFTIWAPRGDPWPWPLWLLGGTFVVTCACFGFHARSRHRRAAEQEGRAESGLCPYCGYDLRAGHDSDRCPECGRMIPSAVAAAYTEDRG